MFLIKKYVPSTIKSFLKNLLRIFCVIIMIIALHICPGQTYRFSSRKFLPSKKFRMSKKDVGTVPYRFLSNESSTFEEINEANAVSPGTSFDLNKLKNFQNPTYLLSFWNSLLIDEDGDIAYSTKDNDKVFKFWSSKVVGHNINIKKNAKYKQYINSNITYVVGDNADLIKKLSEAGHKVLVVNVFPRKNSMNEFENKKNFNKYDHKNVKEISIFDEIINHPTEKPHPGWTQTGAVIPFLSAISFFSKKINVYGWDFFLEDSPENMNYLTLITKLYSKKLDFLRSGTHFEEALINFYLGYKLSLSEKFIIHSHMGKLKKHKSLMNKIEKVFFI